MAPQRHSALCRSLLGASWVPLGLALAAPSTSLAQGAGLSFPQQGIVCDPRGQICFDQQGISMGLTRQYYGRRAEKDLMAQFSSQPLPLEYRLSDGSVCSVTARTCWSDGWRKRVVNQQLTAQQYGRGNNNGVISKDRGFCRLSNFGIQVYNGPCRLIRTVSSDAFVGNTYTVRMGGPQLEVSFGHRSSYLEASSNGRFWPASYRDLGNNNGIFRWGMQQLVVSTSVDGNTPPPVGPNPPTGPAPSAGLNWNGAVEGLLNGLFRP
jgi:hypothetical protein